MLLHVAEDLASFIDELKEETDRGLPLVSASFIDSKLAETILAFLCDGKSSHNLVLGNNAPLGTFSARTEACLALGLIDKIEYDEIQLIRKIRNIFAHHKHGISFENHKVYSLCSKLQKEVLQNADYFPDDSRSRFINSVVALALRLYHRPDWVIKERRHEKTWAKFCIFPDI